MERPWATRMTEGEISTSAPFLSDTLANSLGPGGNSVGPCLRPATVPLPTVKILPYHGLEMRGEHPPPRVHTVRDLNALQCTIRESPE
eukprot:5882651-Alexandrium_andersonii.AAC.1